MPVRREYVGYVVNGPGPSAAVGPHVEGTTQGPSGIPWAEKWPAIRYCVSVAIQTLLAASGVGHCGTAQSNLLPVADTTYSRTVRRAPHPPNGRARAKAPAVCWGFRLVIIPTGH